MVFSLFSQRGTPLLISCLLQQRQTVSCCRTIIHPDSSYKLYWPDSLSAEVSLKAVWATLPCFQLGAQHSVRCLRGDIDYALAACRGGCDVAALAPGGGISAHMYQDLRSIYAQELSAHKAPQHRQRCSSAHVEVVYLWSCLTENKN